ncbi:MAG TPA: hypothetical protein VHU89_07030 [Acidobacteriaceae bacterium]|jgi:hypothetical protein|nr:hypothetical protein [Acidobacteriaceae bacterium]
MNLSNPASRPAVLTSWKDIAQYMGKGVRTVQRWEQDFGLPVRRPRGSNKKAILARPSDLDAWVALRCSSRSDPRAADTEIRPGSRVALGALSSLNAQIQTSRVLHNSNVVLMNDIRSALDQLQSQLRSFAANR